MKDFFNNIRNNEGTISTVLSGAAVVMVAILIFNYVKSVNKVPGQTSSSQTEITEEENNFYTVQQGDNLWSIAEAKYGSGYKWNEIYAANKESISDPGIIEAGMNIKLLAAEKSLQNNSTYIVQTGDNLWNIAESLCGDGFSWTKIASDNNLENPQIIHVGNVLKIGCK